MTYELLAGSCDSGPCPAFHRDRVTGDVKVQGYITGSPVPLPSGEDVVHIPAAALAARLQRQQILFEKGRRFEFLIAESALLWAPDAGVMAAQRDRLLSLVTLPSVEIAIIPIRRTGTPAWHSFIVFETAGEPSFVTTELVHGGQEISDPDAVGRYATLWDRLWRAAATGDEAVDLIRGAELP